MVLDQRMEFAHQRRNFLSVVAEMPSTHNLPIKLEQFGHKLLGAFHSHPERESAQLALPYGRKFPTGVQRAPDIWR